MPHLAQVATARTAKLSDGRQLGFVEHGDPAGTPVFFCHDLFGSRHLRHPDDSILKRLGIRLIGIDRPGYGLSGRKAGRSVFDGAEDMEALFRAMELERCAVLGYSAGAPYALAFAHRYPQQVSRCAVVASLPPLDQAQSFRFIHPVYGRLMQLAHSNPWLFRLLLRGYLFYDSQRSPDQFIRDYGSLLAQVDRHALSQLALFNLRRDIWDEIRQTGGETIGDELAALSRSWGFHLQALRVPVDIWWGEADAYAAPIVGKRMTELIPQANLRLEAKAGHLILFTHWEAILRQLNSPA